MHYSKFRYLSKRFPLYHSRLHVCVGHNLNVVFDEIGQPREPDAELGEACAFEEGKGQEHCVYIVLHPDASPGIMAHEAVHAANFVFAQRGVQLDLANDEPHAYLVGWVVDQLVKALTSKKIKAQREIILK